MTIARHTLWNSSEPYGPFYCDRSDWKTCKDHQHLSLFKPVLPAANLMLTEQDVQGVSLSAYNQHAGETQEYRWVVDPRDVEASMAKAEKIIKRANKQGLSGGFTVTLDESSGHPEIVLSGTPFSKNGWTFVASIEHLPNGEAIVKKSPNYTGPDVEERFLEGNLCEHCNTKKKRRIQVVVEDENGNRKIVGSTCLKDFLGWDYVPNFTMDMGSIEDEMRGAIGDTFHQPIDDVLTVALAISDEYGFVSAGRSDEETMSTKERVNNYINSPDYQKDPAVRSRIQNTNYKSQIAEIRDAVKEETQDSTTDYSRNMKAAFTGDYAFRSTIGLVISGIGMNEKRKNKEAEKKTQEVLSTNIYAPEGSKIQVQAVLMRQSDYQTAYGYGTVYTFVGDGHKFTWFSSAAVNLETGDSYIVKGTVKGLSTYGTEVSTVLTRCKIIE
jgi:hypothetical protein